MNEAAFLVVAGVVGGVATSAGAISSLITYPALLAVGIPPLALGIGFLLGGFAGPVVARRSPPGALRVVIGLAGLVLAAGLLAQAVTGR